MPTDEMLDLERQKLVLEAKRIQDAHELELKKFEWEQSKLPRETFLGKISKNPMAIATVLVAAISYVQFRAAEATRKQELLLAKDKGDAEDDRLWRMALLDFLEKQRVDLFSTDEKKRQEATAVLELSFLTRYSGAVLNKLQIIQGAGSPTTPKVLVEDLLDPLVKELDVSKNAFDNLQPNDTKAEQIIRSANLRARDLLVSKAQLVPAELRQDALQLIEHYDAWFAEYQRVRGANMADQQEPYVFAGPRGVPFPRNAEQRFREALKAQKSLITP